MNSTQLKRIFDLIRETGDRLVVADSSSDDIFVVMSLPDYEDLQGTVIPDKFDFDESNCVDCERCEEYNDYPDSIANLSEQEMLEKINNDISAWKMLQEKNNEISLYEEIEEESLLDVEDEKVEIPEDNLETMQQDGAESQVDEEPVVSEIQDIVKPIRTLPHDMARLGEVLRDDNYRRRDFSTNIRQNIVDEEDLSDVSSEDRDRFYLESVE